MVDKACELLEGWSEPRRLSSMLWADVAGIRGDTEVGSGADSNSGDLGMEGRGATAISPGQLDIVTGRDLEDEQAFINWRFTEELGERCVDNGVENIPRRC